MAGMVKVRLTKEMYLHGRIHYPGEVLQFDEDDVNPSMIRLDGKGVPPPDENNNGPEIKQTLKTLQQEHAKHEVEDDEAKPEAETSKQDGDGGSEADRIRKIKAAAGNLDNASDADWDAHGKPRVSRIEELSGLDTNRKEIDEAIPNVRRQD